MFTSLGDYTASCLYPNNFFTGCQSCALHLQLFFYVFIFYIVNASFQFDIHNCFFLFCVRSRNWSKPDCCCSAHKKSHIIDTLYGFIIYKSNADGTFKIICILCMVKFNYHQKIPTLQNTIIHINYIYWEMATTPFASILSTWAHDNQKTTFVPHPCFLNICFFPYPLTFHGHFFLSLFPLFISKPWCSRLSH